MSVDEEVCEVAVEDDHDGKGASSGGCSDATDEDEDRVREAGEAKLKERKPGLQSGRAHMLKTSTESAKEEIKRILLMIQIL